MFLMCVLIMWPCSQQVMSPKHTSDIHLIGCFISFSKVDRDGKKACSMEALSDEGKI